MNKGITALALIAMAMFALELGAVGISNPGGRIYDPLISSIYQRLERVMTWLGFDRDTRERTINNIYLPDMRAERDSLRALADQLYRELDHPGAKGVLYAGVGEADISPPIGCPSAGYGSRFGIDDDPLHDPYGYHTLYLPMLGVHDRLTSKALVLDDGNMTLAIVSINAIGCAGTVHDQVATMVAPHGIARENLMLAGSHTHSGPGAMATTPWWQLCTVDIFKQSIFDMLTSKIAQSVIQAVESMEPARIGFGYGDCVGISHNRRDDPELDTTVRVIKVERASDGEPLASVFNFAIHPTSLGGDNRYFSGDNMGYAQRYIEQAYGGDIKALFINNCEGDVGCHGGGFDGAKNIGDKLGAEVVEVMDTIVTASDVVLNSAWNDVDLPDPYVRPGLEEESIPIWLTIPLTGLLEDYTAFQAFSINDNVLITIPGEMIVSLGWELLDRADTEYGLSDLYTVGLGNYHISYITDEEEYWEGGYESVATFYGPETGEIVVQAALDTIGMLLAK